MAAAPLADRMRPRNLQAFVGHEALLIAHPWLQAALQRGRLPSLLLWGPPGSGKTTLAEVLAAEVGARCHVLHAVFDGVAELKKVLRAAEDSPLLAAPVLFIDEIHRYNRAQQDALLRAVERGHVTLIGATTENPAFALRAALLSRLQLLPLAPLRDAELSTLLARALAQVQAATPAAASAAGETPAATPAASRPDDMVAAAPARREVDDEAAALARLAEAADGDARRALNLLERTLDLMAACPARYPALSLAVVQAALAHTPLRHDRSGDAHYDVVSAFIKSMRNTDPDAALYWMMRMVEAGEDPRFILRRMLIFASEDIGTADPRALQLAVSADHAFQRLGLPEGLFALGQCCAYLAAAPKSDAAQRGWKAAQAAK
ncbi:MAG: AAA family ATPase, partial [Polyangiales bacterium]